MNYIAKAKKAAKNKKGFTLVELIVVLVILAILAAILVPTMMGWIDEAKKKQYVLEARNVYMAAQAWADRKYATDLFGGGITVDELNADISEIQKLADVDGLAFDSILTGSEAEGEHAQYTIYGMDMLFIPKSDTSWIHAVLKDGTWEIGEESGSDDDYFGDDL